MLQIFLKVLIHLAIRETQLKMPFRFNLPCSERLRLRKQVTTKAGEDVRGAEPSLTSEQTDISKCKIV